METNERLHYRYNFFYITVILVLTVILLITTEWGSIPQLVSMFSFGLTLTSLFLAFIAIIYSIVSNTNFSRYIGNLQEVSSSISESSQKIDDTANNLGERIKGLPIMIQEVSNSVSSSTKQLSDVTIDLGNKAAKLSTEILEVTGSVTKASQQLAEVTEELGSKVSELPSMIQKVGDNLERNQQDFLSQATAIVSQITIQETNEPIPTTEDLITTDDSMLSSKLITRFKIKSSLVGCYLLFCCQLSFQKKKPFDVMKMQELIKSASYDYLHAYLVAMYAIGIIKFEKKGDIVTIKECHDDINDMRSVCEERIMKMFSEDKEDRKEPNREKRRDALDNIEAYFN